MNEPSCALCGNANIDNLVTLSPERANAGACVCVGCAPKGPVMDVAEQWDAIDRQITSSRATASAAPT